MITVDDCRRAGHCASGIRRWFEDYDLDFRKFLKEGISEEEFLATKDARAYRIIELKSERAARGY